MTWKTQPMKIYPQAVSRPLLAVAVVLSAATAAAADADLTALRAAFVREVGPLAAAASEPPPIEPQDNAAVLFLAAADAIPWSTAARDRVNRCLDWSAPFAACSDGDRAALRALLADQRAALADLHRAAERPAASYRRAARVDKGVLLPLIKAARLVAVDNRLAIADRDWARASAASRVLARMATTLEDEPVLLHQLVGIAIEKLFLATVREALSEGAPAAVLHELGRTAPDGSLAAAMRRSLASETAIARADGSLSEAAEAAHLRLLLALVRHSGHGRSRLEAVVPSAGDRPDGERMRANLLDVDGRFHGMLRQRQLARAALALRLRALAEGDYPARLDGVAGIDHRREPAIVWDTGERTVSLAGAAALWPHIARHEPSRTLLVWSLPRP